MLLLGTRTVTFCPVIFICLYQTNSKHKCQDQDVNTVEWSDNFYGG